MSLPRLYLETTIPSYLTARPSRDIALAGQQEVTRRWWNDCRGDYELCVSQFVESEASQGDPEMVAARLAKLDGVLRLPVTAEALALADELIAAGLVPAKARVDAAHIGVATIHRLEYLLTWNCRHIRNPDKLWQIARLCSKLGYECPRICTPDDLLER
ncbi:MAG: type II toxin-antitoxin system VapC family toxin [Chthoniobacteraceae bacterium]